MRTSLRRSRRTLYKDTFVRNGCCVPRIHIVPKNRCVVMHVGSSAFMAAIQILDLVSFLPMCAYCVVCPGLRCRSFVLCLEIMVRPLTVADVPGSHPVSSRGNCRLVHPHIWCVLKVVVVCVCVGEGVLPCCQAVSGSVVFLSDCIFSLLDSIVLPSTNCGSEEGSRHVTVIVRL